MAFGTTLTWEQVQELMKEQQDNFAKQMATTIAEITKMNPLQQKAYDEQMMQEKRKANMVLALGRAEEEAAHKKKHGCSHMIYPAGHRRAGEGAPRGAMGAEFITGGQAYQNGTAMVMCLRCQQVWLFRPNPDFYNAILQNGLLGEQPPAEEYLLCNGCLEPKKQCKCAERNDNYRQARAEMSVSA